MNRTVAAQPAHPAQPLTGELSAFSTQPDQPPAYLGRCTGWNFNGPAVAQYYPQFIGWHIPEGKGNALPPPAHPQDAPTPHGAD